MKGYEKYKKCEFILLDKNKHFIVLRNHYHKMAINHYPVINITIKNNRSIGFRTYELGLLGFSLIYYRYD